MNNYAEYRKILRPTDKDMIRDMGIYQDKIKYKINYKVRMCKKYVDLKAKVTTVRVWV
jgi:hypothetical protein